MHRAFLLTAVCLLTASTGCQSEVDRVYPVSGKITFSDGSPAQFGIIEFRSQSPDPVIARGKIEKDGSFRVRASGRQWGLTQGKHTGVIIQIVGNPRGQPKLVHKHGLEVADKYRDYKSSDLNIEVAPDGDNHFELIVDSK